MPGPEAIHGRQSLYRRVDEIRSQLPAGDLLYTAQTLIPVYFHPFDGRCLGAMIMGEDCILVNSSYPRTAQRFSLAHEMIHLFLHIRPHAPRSRWDEWQANEGAAQLLVPYQSFLPEVARRRILYTQDRPALERLLAKRYGVSPTVIRNRFSDLRAPLENHLAGCPLEQVFAPCGRALRPASGNIDVYR